MPSKKYPEIEISENPLGISADFVFHKQKNLPAMANASQLSN
ncbi:hypothetical protein SS322685_5146 [Shigella sonnei 3226-85]|nr:hypothetical protein SS53G_2223 [Shigella sonnei 53G]EIQ35926.1 hypothetical protein SS322685_5146 [Shigella sonnei 3226-85]